MSHIVLQPSKAEISCDVIEYDTSSGGNKIKIRVDRKVLEAHKMSSFDFLYSRVKSVVIYGCCGEDTVLDTGLNGMHACGISCDTAQVGSNEILFRCDSIVIRKIPLHLREGQELKDIISRIEEATNAWRRKESF